MISFRITGKEYERFRSVCASRGLANVSELVRAALNKLVEEAASDPPSLAQEIQARISGIEARLTDLATTVAQMEGHPPLSHSAGASSTLQYSQSASGQ